MGHCFMIKHEASASPTPAINFPIPAGVIKGRCIFPRDSKGPDNILSQAPTNEKRGPDSWRGSLRGLFIG